MKHEQTLQTYRSLFADFERTLNGGAGSTAHALRREALTRFAERGFPTVRDEDWRYTNVNPIAGTAFTAAPAVQADSALRDAVMANAVAVPDALTLLFVNGRFQPALSDLDALPDGVEVAAIDERLDGDGLPGGNPAMAAEVLARNPFAELNSAFLNHGVVISVRKGVVIPRPLHLLFWSAEADAPYVTQPRVVLRLGAGAQLDVVEQYAGADGAVYFTNTLSDIRVEDAAVLRHVKLQDESVAAFHVGSIHASAGRGAVYENHGIGFGAALQRGNIHGVLDGEGGHVTMNGLFLPRGTQHMDHFTTIDHAVPHCTSHELYKGVLSDEARGVFTGKIIVRQDAQKTDAVQANNNLLLSERAQVDTRPQLEIYADDVKCTHGATVGRISEDQLFYLLSRGIPRRRAHAILTYAFAADIIGRIPLAAVREALDAELHRRLDESWTNG